MEIRDNNKVCIFAPLSPKLDKRESLRLFANLKNEVRNVAIDLSYVQDCTIDFIKELREISLTKQIGIFNIPSDIFVLFNIMNLDKTAQLFVCEEDFEENTRRLINRRFSII